MQNNLLANGKEKFLLIFLKSTMHKPLPYRCLPRGFFEWLNLVDINCFRHGFSVYLKQNYQIFSAFLINVNSGCSDNNINKTPGII
jgi:hypothetical protein